MIAYASRTGTRSTLAALRSAGWRLLVSAAGELRTEGFRYALDNGAWSAHQAGQPFDEAAFLRALDLLGRDADFVFMDRAAIGLGSVFLHLKAEINWYQLFHELIRDFDVATLAARQATIRTAISRRVPGPEALQVAEFIGELCGVGFPDADSVKLRAARQDPRIMSDQLRQAFTTLLREECRATPTVLVLDDLQWGDALRSSSWKPPCVSCTISR